MNDTGQERRAGGTCLLLPPVREPQCKAKTGSWLPDLGRRRGRKRSGLPCDGSAREDTSRLEQIALPFPPAVSRPRRHRHAADTRSLGIAVSCSAELPELVLLEAEKKVCGPLCQVKRCAGRRPSSRLAALASLALDFWLVACGREDARLGRRWLPWTRVLVPGGIRVEPGGRRAARSCCLASVCLRGLSLSGRWASLGAGVWGHLAWGCASKAGTV